MSEQLAPAQTYELNMLASATGRFAVANIDRVTIQQADVLTDLALQRLHESDKPVVPHTLPELLNQAIKFDEGLLAQLKQGPANNYMSRSLLNASQSIVTAHRSSCKDLLTKGTPYEQLVKPLDIAKAYGLPHMWEEAPSILVDEVKMWGKQTAHPAIPEDLTKLVSKSETEELILFIWKDILAIDHDLDAQIYITDADNKYHLFWVPTSAKLDYATPNNYERATQLSFDLPHNVAHLAHLAALDAEVGVNRFTDQMQERAFFEAVAVFSEYVMTLVCSNQPERLVDMATIFGLPQTDNSTESLSHWLLEDRKYEFKLRAARLYADLLITQGMPFNEAVREISDNLGLTEHATKAEIKKYLPWTGLGAVYTTGYITLLKIGILTVPQAITGKNGPITTWAQFNDEHGL